MPGGPGTAIALVTPGTTSTGTPAATHASTSSIPRPKTNGSPPLSRTTTRPARACSTSSRLISSCAIDRPPGTLAASMTVDLGAELVEQRQRCQPVGDHDVGLGERGPAAHRDQARVAGATADQDHPPGPWAPGRRCGRELGGCDEGVAHGGGARRVAVGVHRDGVRPGPPGRRDPGRRLAGVVGAHAQDVRCCSASAATAAFTAGSSVQAMTSQASVEVPGAYGRRRPSVSRPAAAMSASAGVMCGATTVTSAPASSRPATRRSATGRLRPRRPRRPPGAARAGTPRP